MPIRSHNPKKTSLRKGFKHFLLGDLEKRVRPSRTELQKAEKEKRKKGNSRPQAPASSSSSSSSAAKPSTSSKVARLTGLASETNLLPGASNPLLQSNFEIPGVQKQTFVATNDSSTDESDINAVHPQDQSQEQTLYHLRYRTLATSAPYSEPYSLPISEQDTQYTAPSFTSVTQASGLEPDTNDHFVLPEPTQTTPWTDFGFVLQYLLHRGCTDRLPSAPNIQSPLVPDYIQYLGVPSGPAWPSNMGQDVQQGLLPSNPYISSTSSSSAGQDSNLVKVTFDGGYSIYQVVELDCRWDFNFISQSSVDMLQRLHPMQVISFPPGIGRKTQCPNGGLVSIERILYVGVEFESHHLPFPPVRVYFVVYDDFGGEDGVHITLGQDWVNKIEQAYPQIGYQGQQ
ncbi:hypothetical protein F52700_12353 [Fusarium sp. NRRL 52700]|nr:hypothetical protein F52700_12353 [Fusarium sp. NRRL 52700]